MTAAEALLAPRRVEIIRAVLAPFAAKIDRVALFGSRATGRGRENSDIDIVIYGQLSPAEVDRLWTLFNESPLSVPVDIVAYNLTPYPQLKRHIDEVAKVLFNREDLAESS